MGKQRKAFLEVIKYREGDKIQLPGFCCFELVNSTNNMVNNHIKKKTSSEIITEAFQKNTGVWACMVMIDSIAYIIQEYETQPGDIIWASYADPMTDQVKKCHAFIILEDGYYADCTDATGVRIFNNIEELLSDGYLRCWGLTYYRLRGLDDE